MSYSIETYDKAQNILDRRKEKPHSKHKTELINYAPKSPSLM